MRIAIATTQVPFIRGGAEAMTEGLQNALKAAGHSVEVISMPFCFSPLAEVVNNCEAWRREDFERFDIGLIDQVIALKFPAYQLQHPNKSVWLMHQHRSVYELANTEYGERIDSSTRYLQERIIDMDGEVLSKVRSVYTISKTVSERLRGYNGVESTPLYQPPPNAESYRSDPIFPYIFCPSRIEDLKRQVLLIRAMQFVDKPIQAYIAGEGGGYIKCMQLIEDLDLGNRVKMLGRIESELMIRLYANSLGVFFAPLLEDYGFITLESMLSSKPVITCHDSGGPTEFVLDGETGCICDPEPEMIAKAINALWADKKRAIEMGVNAREHYESMNISWSNVVQTLTERLV